MMKQWLYRLFWVCFVVSGASVLLSAPVQALSVSQVPNPRENGAWVSDTVDVLPVNAEENINQKLSLLEKETGIEVALVTVESVDTPTAKEFSTELFNTWGIGKSGNDNGLLILLVLGERRLEMETGYGLEAALPDGWLKTMQLEQMIPHFKENRYDLGLEAGVEAVVVRLRANLRAIPEPLPAVKPKSSAEESNYYWIWGFGFGVFLLLLVWSDRRGKRIPARAYPTCPGCHKPGFRLLSGVEDDAFLDAGEIMEEQLRTVDYQVYHCKDCGFHSKNRIEHWMPIYWKCHRCHYVTLRQKSEILLKPTSSDIGMERLSVWCLHCKLNEEKLVSIPPVFEAETEVSGFSSRVSGEQYGFERELPRREERDDRETADRERRRREERERDERERADRERRRREERERDENERRKREKREKEEREKRKRDERERAEREKRERENERYSAASGGGSSSSGSRSSGGSSSKSSKGSGGSFGGGKSGGGGAGSSW